MLRLCNRYGKGDHAAIARVPIELMHTIEGYLVEEARCRLREEWIISFKCFERRCALISHYTAEQLPEACRILNEDPYLPYKYEEPQELSEGELEDLERDLWEYGDWGDSHDLPPWTEIHEPRVRDWERKTGAPTRTYRGFFSENSIVLKKYLGLEVRIRHTNWNDYDRATKRWCDMPENQACPSTSAYLVLGKASGFRETLERREEARAELVQDCINAGTPIYKPTESSFTLPVVMPRTLPDKAVARFTRAWKLLGLPKDCQDEAKRAALSAREEDNRATEEAFNKTDNADADMNTAGPQPRLMLFLRVDDVPSGADHYFPID